MIHMDTIDNFNAKMSALRAGEADGWAMDEAAFVDEITGTWWVGLIRKDEDGYLTTLCKAEYTGGRCTDRGQYGDYYVVPVLLMNPDAYGEPIFNRFDPHERGITVTVASARRCLYGFAGEYDYLPVAVEDSIFGHMETEGLIWGSPPDDDPCEPQYCEMALVWHRIVDLRVDVEDALMTFVERSSTNFVQAPNGVTGPDVTDYVGEWPKEG